MEVNKLSEAGNMFQAFPGVSGKVLLSGSNVMLLMFEIAPSSSVPEHNHPNEQMGICLSGKAEFSADGDTRLVDPGTVYRFESNERHGVRALGEEAVILLEVFSPPREDYLRRAQE